MKKSIPRQGKALRRVAGAEASRRSKESGSLEAKARSAVLAEEPGLRED